MAVQIDVATQTPGGLAVPAGALVVFTTMFPATKLEMKMTLAVYKDVATAQQRLEPIQDGIDGLAEKHTFTYDIVEFGQLDQAAIMAKQTELVEAVVGVGNTTTITIDLLQPTEE